MLLLRCWTSQHGPKPLRFAVGLVLQFSIVVVSVVDLPILCDRRVMHPLGNTEAFDQSNRLSPNLFAQAFMFLLHLLSGARVKQPFREEELHVITDVAEAVKHEKASEVIAHGFRGGLDRARKRTEPHRLRIGPGHSLDKWGLLEHPDLEHSLLLSFRLQGHLQSKLAKQKPLSPREHAHHPVRSSDGSRWTRAFVRLVLCLEGLRTKLCVGANVVRPHLGEQFFGNFLHDHLIVTLRRHPGVGEGISLSETIRSQEALAAASFSARGGDVA
mmetsp:Transcript_18926/g.36364  ORF Transcript_18926/g.36364 Transcript_18926/m.36364 type:complete len:272 (+) Transcript_18926:533-1348(+)